jgi:hypothetical protein
MPSIINSDDGVVSGTSGLKTTGGNDGLLNIQTNGSTAMSINASQQVTFNNGINLPSTFGFKNRLINGGMVIDQRNNGASISFPGGDGNYCLDRWRLQRQGAATGTIQRSSVAPSGFTNSLLVTVSSGAAPSATDFYTVGQVIEGFNSADLNWGTASASSVAISFWIRSSITGTYAASVYNIGAVETYPATFTINSANTWEYKTVTIPGSTSGTWATGSAGSIYMRIDLGSGSNYNGTANAWNASGGFRTSSSVNLMANTGATLYLTGVQLERGSAATSFDFRSIGQELVLCQRYYEVYYQDTGGVWPVGMYYNSTNYFSYWAFKVEKRAQATVTRVGGSWSGATPTLYNGISSASFYASVAFYMNATAGTKCLEAAAEL